MLKTSDLLPYVVFITVPRMDQLNRLREYDPNGEPFNPNVRLKVRIKMIYSRYPFLFDKSKSRTKTANCFACDQYKRVDIVI